MKVEVIEKEEKKEEFIYPFIGCSRIRTVLFCSSSKGTILKSTDPFEVGQYVDDWKMDQFKQLEGKVILEND